MSLVIPPSLKSQATTCRSQYLATCWRITWRDRNIVFRFTDHPLEIQLREGTGPDTETYTPTDGVDSSARRRVAEAEANNKELRGIVSSDAITVEDLRAGMFDGATVEEYIVDPRLAWAGFIEHASYIIQNVKFDRGVWEAQIADRVALLARNSGSVWTPRCRVELFSAACGLDPDDYDISATINAVYDDWHLRVALTTSGDWGTDGWANDGTVIWLTGDNADLRDMIKEYDFDTSGFAFLKLYRPLRFAPQVGDTMTLLPGCNKIAVGELSGSAYEGDCKEKFDNVINFQGEPYIPGRDKVLRGRSY